MKILKNLWEFLVAIFIAIIFIVIIIAVIVANVFYWLYCKIFNRMDKFEQYTLFKHFDF